MNSDILLPKPATEGRKADSPRDAVPVQPRPITLDYSKEALKRHKDWRGKIEIIPRAKIHGQDDLATAYTPGVAAPCLAIKDDPEQIYTYCGKGNLVAVVTDGSAVLGLGNIGPEAALPVMEGKAVLFKEFGDVDAVPICLDTQDTDEIVRTVELLAPGFGGINLEDISAPRCFEIESRLREKLNIPVFHDDQRGTAVVALAAVMNALKLAEKAPENARVVISGAGSAGISIARLLTAWGVKDIILSDKIGLLHPDAEGMNDTQKQMAEITNPRRVTGTLADALKGADVFIGVSAPGIVSQDMIRSMNDKAAVFAMANPVPEIMPEESREAGAWIIGTGRSDYPNQINNVLAFPGIFRGALDARAKDITDAMLLRAAQAIAQVAEEDGLTTQAIIPSALDERVAKHVAAAVADCVREDRAQLSGRS